MVVLGVHAIGDGQLPGIGHAGGALRRELGLLEHGQQNRNQNRDDGDHHEQFDECKTTASALDELNRHVFTSKDVHQES